MRIQLSPKPVWHGVNVNLIPDAVAGANGQFATLEIGRSISLLCFDLIPSKWNRGDTGHA
jgi:hypothetical protein